MAGALSETKLLRVVELVGFENVTLVARFEAYEGTSTLESSPKLAPRGVTVYATK